MVGGGANQMQLHAWSCWRYIGAYVGLHANGVVHMQFDSIIISYE